MENWLDVRPFCEIAVTDRNANALEFTWADARDIHRIEIDVRDLPAGIDNGTNFATAVKYWRSTWPKNRPTEGEKQGSGQSGWNRQDDWYRGLWQTADIFTMIGGSTLLISFAPLNRKEFPEENFAANFRRTLKIRVELNKEVVNVESVKGVHIYSTSTRTRESFSLEICASEKQSVNKFRAEAFNGLFVQEQEIPKPTNYVREIEFLREQYVDILCANKAHEHSFDETLVTIIPILNSESIIRPFTFAMDDLRKRDFLFIPDLGVLVKKEGKDCTYEQLIRQSSDSPNFSIYERIFHRPDQTFNQAMKEFEEKAPFYMVLGCEGTRSKCAVTVAGDLYTSSQYIRKVPGPDTPQLFWDLMFAGITFAWAVGNEPIPPEVFKRPVTREIEDGYLPIIHTKWKDLVTGISITQTAFTTVLSGTKVNVKPPGDAPILGMLKFTITNDSPDAREVHWSMRAGQCASLDMVEQPLQPLFNNANASDSELDSAFIFKFQAQEPLPAHQAYTCVAKITGGHKLTAINETGPDAGTIRLTLRVASKHHREFEIFVPLLAIPQANETQTLGTLLKMDFSREHGQVALYWKERIQPFSIIEVPNHELSCFYKAHLIHVLITDDQEIGSNRVVGRVGSFRYGCYANEVCMIIQVLDQRGAFAEARAMLDVFIHYQGTAGLEGAYEEMDGIFFGANGYESGPGYNQNQGWVLWTIADHVRLSGDLEWFQANSQSVIKGCDWIINERLIFARQIDALRNASNAPTIFQYGPPFDGLLPPGGVEDLVDYWHWLSTNAYNCYGLARAAGILTQIHHPDAPRISTEAKHYVDAVRTCFTRAMERSPVVSLRNGTFIPHVPCHPLRRGRGFGWIQETLEGAIHLLRCGILNPNSREATWIIQDLEDNLYLSEEYGYPYIGESFEQNWFNRGGFSMQPFLLCNHILYATRREYKPFLRAFFNAFAVNYRPDTKMFTEHPLPTMFDWRGDHFKTSDESQCIGCLRAMLVQETRADNEVSFSQDDSVPTSFSGIDQKNANDGFRSPDSLSFFELTPREWLADGLSIHARGLPTYFGMIDVDLTSHIQKKIVNIVVQLDPLPTRSNLSVKQFFFTTRLPNPETRIESAVFSLMIGSGESELQTLPIQEIKENWIHVLLPESFVDHGKITIQGRVKFA